MNMGQWELSYFLLTFLLELLEDLVIKLLLPFGRALNEIGPTSPVWIVCKVWRLGVPVLLMLSKVKSSGSLASAIISIAWSWAAWWISVSYGVQIDDDSTMPWKEVIQAVQLFWCFSAWRIAPFLFLIFDEIHTSAGGCLLEQPISPWGHPVVCCNIAGFEHNFPIITSCLLIFTTTCDVMPRCKVYFSIFLGNSQRLLTDHQALEKMKSRQVVPIACHRIFAVWIGRINNPKELLNLGGKEVYSCMVRVNIKS